MGNRSENFIHEILLLLWIRSQGFYNKRYYKLRATYRSQDFYNKRYYKLRAT